MDVRSLLEAERPSTFPVNLDINDVTPIDLMDLTWFNYDVPARKLYVKLVKDTVVLTGKWPRERPYLTSGCLHGNYEFSHLHFHFLPNDMGGSVHCIDCERFPMEMHVVHYKTDYGDQGTALKKKDGVVILVYFFKLQKTVNACLQSLLSSIKKLQDRLQVQIRPAPLSLYCRPFNKDYFAYWGNVESSSCCHSILWIIGREPIGITPTQISAFWMLSLRISTSVQLPLTTMHTMQPGSLFHVNPVVPRTHLLLAIPKGPCPVVSRLGESYLHMPNGDPLSSEVSRALWPFKVVHRQKGHFSPINIESSTAQMREFPPLQISCLTFCKHPVTILNTGRSVQMTLQYTNNSVLMVGGPLPDVYQFNELHFHWGPNDLVGSEHTIDGQNYSMEAHIVYFLKKYGSFDEAFSKEGGLTIVAVFLKAGNEVNSNFDVLSSCLGNIKTSRSKTTATYAFKWLDVLQPRGYFTYAGTLTVPKSTPPVTWIIYPEPIDISYSQVSAFRQLRKGHSPILKSFNSAQDLQRRPVLYCV